MVIFQFLWLNTNLQRMFLRSEEPFVVSPSLDESEPARLPRGVSQGIHNILQYGERLGYLGCDEHVTTLGN